MIKVTLFLMSEKGYDVLSALLNEDYHNLIHRVIVGRDRNVINDFSDEIIELCTIHNINWCNRVDNYKLDSGYAMAISWRWIINQKSLKLIVLHDSILPRYRGFSPLVNMLLNKEKEIGVTALFASEQYDKGDIITQTSVDVNYPITIIEAIKIISKKYIELALFIFSELKAGKKIDAKPQNHDKATYSLWRNNRDYLIDWNKSSEDILHFINVLSEPYKGAMAYINGNQLIRILNAEVVEDVEVENRDIGKVIFVDDGMPVVVCGTGLLKLKKVVDDVTRKTVLPLKNFRTIFGKTKY